MRRFLLSIVLVCAAAGAAAQSSVAAVEKKDMEAFMAEYLKVWNRHDAATITERMYRLGPNHAWTKKEGLQAEFDRLASQGYDHSVTASIIGCVTGAGEGQVELRYTRLKTDGTFMPPKDRTSVYTLKKFTDGWRAVAIKALGEGQRMECAGSP